MNPAALDIDRIVREVIQRLAERSSAAPATSSSTPISHPAAPEPEPATAVSSDLAIDAKVVTVESLRNRLQGIRRLVVSPGAIVTPAVRDLLKEGKITLERQASASPAKAEANAGVPDIVIALCDTKATPGSYRDAVPASLNCEMLSADRMAQGVRRVAAAVNRDHCLGIVITRDVFPALCLASRHRGTRAALATSVEAIEQAIATAGVNLLIVDATARGSWQIKRLIAAFCRRTERQCPDVLLETP